MAAAPDHSIPDQHGDWSDVKAAYRFLNHEGVSPEEIQRTHREQVRAACSSHSYILAIQDTTNLDFTSRSSVEGLGKTTQRGRGLLQHSTLAVTPAGGLLGVLHQIWHAAMPVDESETRKQRRTRFKLSDFWSDSVKAIGLLDSATRLIHVTDRGGDSFELMQTCLTQGAGFLIRAQHDRYVNDQDERLWAYLQRQPVAGTHDVAVSARSPRPARIVQPAQKARPSRVAKLAIRHAPVVIPTPQNDPRFHTSLSMWAVYAVEMDPPADTTPIEWLLLTSEPVNAFEQADACVEWYTHRWKIEEWHKAEKTGCRLEASQLKHADAIRCLAALTAVVAVRMIQLRDLAQAAMPKTSKRTETPNSTHSRPLSEALQAIVPRNWIRVVSHLAKCRPDELTPHRFWITVAKRGGFLARRSDGMPGWQTIWKGWSEVMLLVQGLELQSAIEQNESETYG